MPTDAPDAASEAPEKLPSSGVSCEDGSGRDFDRLFAKYKRLRREYDTLRSNYDQNCEALGLLIRKCRESQKLATKWKDTAESLLERTTANKAAFPQSDSRNTEGCGRAPRCSRGSSCPATAGERPKHGEQTVDHGQSLAIGEDARDGLDTHSGITGIQNARESCYGQGESSPPPDLVGSIDLDELAGWIQSPRKRRRIVVRPDEAELSPSAAPDCDLRNLAGEPQHAIKQERLSPEPDDVVPIKAEPVSQTCIKTNSRSILYERSATDLRRKGHSSPLWPRNTNETHNKRAIKQEDNGQENAPGLIPWLDDGMDGVQRETGDLSKAHVAAQRPPSNRPRMVSKRARQTSRAGIKLRHRPIEELTIDDFRVNPRYNQGRTHAFTEVVRQREARRCLPGCTTAQCCGSIFRKAVEIGGLPLPSPRSARDGRHDVRATEDDLLRWYAGDALPIQRLSEGRRKELLLEAQTQKFADQHGKHRHAFVRSSTPPGFWQADMPTSQERARYLAQSRLMENEKLAERRREALKNGRWLFRDER